ncbi:GntR family transcriptional regulator [Leucobacter sp. GX24907]
MSPSPDRTASPERTSSPPPRAQQLIADAMRARILSGDLVPGAPLREEELATRYDASRHTVRSALLLLAAERLVHTAPYRGAWVASFDDDEILALQDLRCALESASVRILHRRHGDVWPRQVLRPLEYALEELADAETSRSRTQTSNMQISSNDDTGAEPDSAAMRISRAHVAFHDALVRASESERIIEAYERIGSEILMLTAHVRPHYEPGAFEPQHRDYLREVQTGDVESVWRHLSVSTELLLAHRD